MHLLDRALLLEGLITGHSQNEGRGRTEGETNTQE